MYLIFNMQYYYQITCFSFLDDETAPIRYNRRCASNNGLDDGCTKANIEMPDGTVYPGRVCFCTSGDDCNTEV